MVAILAVTGLTGIAAATPASAVTRDGVHPTAATCYKDRVMKRQTPIYTYERVYLGAVQLWYSPSCRSVWSRVVTAKPAVPVARGFNYGAYARVWRNTDRKRFDCESINGSTNCLTRMLNDKNVTSYAEGLIWYNGKYHWARTTSY